MKFYKKYFSLHHWLAFLRRQPHQMQQMYAVIFAGGITVFLGAIILYYDYGFWRDKYSRNETVQVKTIDDSSVTVESPSEMIGSFLEEAKVRFKAINSVDNKNLLEGKDVYTKEGSARQ